MRCSFSYYFVFLSIFHKVNTIRNIYLYFPKYRALELAVRHKKQLEEVLEARAKYLQTIDKKETNQSFLTHIAKSQPVNEVS